MEMTSAGEAGQRGGTIAYTCLEDPEGVGYCRRE